MPKKKSPKKALDSFTEMVREFGDAVGEIFDDPELKKAAKAFTSAAKRSAKTFSGRFKDEEVQRQFKEVGDKAKGFGQDMKKVAQDVHKTAKGVCKKCRK